MSLKREPVAGVLLLTALTAPGMVWTTGHDGSHGHTHQESQRSPERIGRSAINVQSTSSMADFVVVKAM